MLPNTLVTVYYDPLCGWCYGATPCVRKLGEQPGLNVELVMSLRDYQSFCIANRVIQLTRDEGEALDLEHLKWRYGQPGLPE